MFSLFRNNEIDSEVIESLSSFATYMVEEIVGEQSESITSYDLSITDPIDEGWDIQTWEEDIDKKFDSVTTIYEDGTVVQDSLYKDVYVIEIPARFNLYNDLYSNDAESAVKYTQFEIEGILVTPHDGLVYDTSNKELFKSGDAKSPGKYLYFDSNGDNFYETVYILENSISENIEEKPIYVVKSIGYNYDGTHDFAPYKTVDRKKVVETDFLQLASETPKRFGSFWTVNFRKLTSNRLLFPVDPFDGYEAKDSIFEVSKLSTPSEFNSKFPELFYEVRHREYSNAWTIYAAQLAQDTLEQVFMTLTATAASAALQWIPIAGQILGPLAYFGVYTLMTKFSIDLKMHKADAMAKASTFTPVSLDDVKPLSLNERSDATHGYWGESTVATLMGHPGAYYTTIRGETKGQEYTAQAIVSPASLARYNSGKNRKGFLDFLGNNFWLAGNSDPDLMVGLDYDGLNLDYLLMTSELSALNDNPDYSFEASAYNWQYGQYKHTTLGYLQQKVAEESNTELSLIKPVMIDGIPQYIFVDGTNDFNHLTMPTTHLYQPIIVDADSEARNEGTITVNIRTAYETNTKGIRHQTSYPEKSIYASKVPLSTHGFEYPITSIKIELMEQSLFSGQAWAVDSVSFTSDSAGFEDIFEVEFGNLYFHDDIDMMVVGGEANYLGMVLDGLLTVGTKKYYRLTLKFDMVIPDDNTEKHKKMALTQATAYSIMDYFNQFTFAKTTAEMIGEIAYTETLTAISTSISAASIVLGSWTVAGLKGVFAQAGVSLSKQLLVMAGQFGYSVVMGSVKEMFEEIIIDGFLETAGEKWMKSMGHSDDIAFWFTSLLTAGRETFGGGIRSVLTKSLGSKFGSIKIKGKDIRTRVNERYGINPNSDVALQNEFIDLVNELNTNEKGKNKNKIDRIKSWKQIAGSGLLGIAISIIPSIFTGGMFFSGFMSTMGIVNKIEGIFGDVIGRANTQLAIARMTGGNYEGLNLGRLSKLVKGISKPKIDKEQLDQEYTTKNLVPMTAVDISRIFNPNFAQYKKASEFTETSQSTDSSLDLDYTDDTFISVDKKEEVKHKDIKQRQNRLRGFKAAAIGLQDSMDIGFVAVPDDVEGLDLENDPVIEIDGIRYWIVPGISASGRTRWYNYKTGKTLKFTQGTITLGTFLSILYLKKGEIVTYKGHKLEAGEVVDVDNGDGSVTRIPLREDMALSKVFDLIGYPHSINSLRNQIRRQGDPLRQDSLKVVNRKPTLREKLASTRSQQISPQTFKAETILRSLQDNYPNLVDLISKWSSHFEGFENLLAIMESPDGKKSELHDKFQVFEGMYFFVKQEAKAFVNKFFANGRFDSTQFKASFKSYFDMKYDGVDPVFAEAIYDTMFKPGLDKKLNAWIVTQQAEFLLLDIIMRDFMRIHISPKSGGPRITDIASNLKTFMKDPNNLFGITQFLASGYGHYAFFDTFREGFFDNARTELSLSRNLNAFTGGVLEGKDAFELAPEDLKNLPPGSILEAVINGGNFGIPKLGTSHGLNEYIDAKSYRQLVEYILFNSDITEIYQSLTGSNRVLIDSIGAVLTNKELRVREQKNTRDKSGVTHDAKRSIANDLMRDAFFLVLIELAKFQNPQGNIPLGDLRSLRLTATVASKNPVSDLMEIVNSMGWFISFQKYTKFPSGETMAEKNRFSQFSSTGTVKFPTMYTLIYSVADKLNTIIEGKNSFDALMDIQNLLGTDSFLQTIKDLAEGIFPEERFAGLTDRFFESINDYFVTNLASLLLPTADGKGLEISLSESVNLLFNKLDSGGNPIKLEVGDLPRDIKIFQNGRWIDLRSLYSTSHTLSSAYIAVHGLDGNIVINGLMKVENVRNELPSGIKEGFRQVLEDSNGDPYEIVYHNVFVSDAHGNFLYSKINQAYFTDVDNRNNVVKPIGWQQSHIAGSGILNKNFYICFGLTSGSQYLSFLFNANTDINAESPLEAYLPDRAYDDSNDYFANYEDPLDGPSFKNSYGQSEMKTIQAFLSILYQIFGASPSGLSGDLALTQSMISLFGDGTGETPNGYTYSVAYWESVINSLLKGYTTAEARAILDIIMRSKVVNTPGTSTPFSQELELTISDDKPYYRTWLELIIRDMDSATPSGLFPENKFGYLRNVQFSTYLGKTDQVIVDGIYDDLESIEMINWALGDVFGELGFTLIDCGFLTFDQSIESGYSFYKAIPNITIQDKDQVP